MKMKVSANISNRIIIFWMFWVRQATIYETLCATTGCCRPQLSKYSLADMSYVPYFRRFETGSPEKREQEVIQHSFQNKGHSMQKIADLWSAKTIKSEAQTQSHTVNETLAVSGNGSLKAIMIEERIESSSHLNNSANTTASNNVTEELTDEYFGHFGDDQISSTGCGHYEMSYGGLCYFVTKDLVSGYRANFVCGQSFVGGEMATIPNNDTHAETMKFLRWWNVRSKNKPPHQRVHYIYIHPHPSMKNQNQNSAETSFKANLCGSDGCQCMAVNLVKGSWHERFCYTRHQVLCSRRQHFKEEEKKIATESTVVDVFGQVSSGTPTAVVSIVIVVTLLSVHRGFCVL